MDDFASQLNFVVAAVIFLVGVGIVLSKPIKKSHLLNDRPFLLHPFLFWLGQWFSLVLVWILVAFRVGNKIEILAIIDLQSVFAIGFCIAFWQGEKYRWQTGGYLIMVYLLLLLSDIGAGLYIGKVEGSWVLDAMNPVGPESLMNWLIAPSQVLSVIADCSLAVVFFLRYGSAALPLVLACVFYALLQRPVYAGTFISPPGEDGVRLALAAGKALIGSTFYSLFFERAQNYESIKVPILHASNLAPKKMMLRGGGILLVQVVSAMLLSHRMQAEAWKILIAGKVLLGGVITGVLVGWILQKINKPSRPESPPESLTPQK